jgi:Cu+-exporting ATPase
MDLPIRLFAGVLRRAGRHARSDRDGHEVRVRVKDSFEPDVIRASTGRPLRLVFRREETAANSERVVLPAFGRSATLPPYEDVTLEIVPEETGEFEFACELGRPRGLLVVSDGPADSRLPRRQSPKGEMR